MSHIIQIMLLPYVVLSLTVSIFYLGLILYTLSTAINIPLAEIFYGFTSSFYMPHVNSFTTNISIEINSYRLLYLIFLLTCPTVALTKRLLTKKTVARAFIDRQSLYGTCLALLIITILFQTKSQIVWRIRENKILSGKTIEEKISTYHAKPFHFARFCQQSLPGKHFCQLSTDMDLKNNAVDLFHYLAWTYYLYPIDVRLDKERPKDCLILFNKKDAAKSIPKGFTVIGVFDSSNAVAIKEQ